MYLSKHAYRVEICETKDSIVMKTKYFDHEIIIN